MMSLDRRDLGLALQYSLFKYYHFPHAATNVGEKGLVIMEEEVKHRYVRIIVFLWCSTLLSIPEARNSFAIVLKVSK
jgi:hypothetical protein